MNRPCAHFFLAFKKLNAKAGPLSPSTKGLGFKVKPNQRSQAELMGVFQAHRRRAQRIWKHLHKAVYHKRNIQFSSCSHLHGGLRNSYSQSLHYQRLKFLLPFQSDTCYSPVFAEQTSNWSFPSAVTKVYAQLQSSLTQLCILHQKRRYRLNNHNAGWKLSLLSWQHAKHAWFCWGACNTAPVAFCWVWVKKQSGISIKYNGNRDFVVMNKEVIAAGQRAKIHTSQWM